MAELKTQPTGASVDEFIASITDPQQRQDSAALVAMMRKLTKAEPEMWGPSIVGFGRYQYKYDSGRKGEWFLAGFSPRKQNMTLYLMGGPTRHPELLETLGKHKVSGGSCIYFKKLADLDRKTLEKLIREGVKAIKGTKAAGATH